MSDLFEQTYNPDVLSCLANLSNDEVFTPPEVANQMLDLLPEEIWRDSSATFLDPACKSGVFLREIAKRLIDGLEDEIPELQERLEHIFKEQIYGIATTELCSLLSRRSTYCSKYPNCKYSVVQFDNVEGNIRYKQCKHHWVGGRCSDCGASQKELDRDDGRESYAYELIHLADPKEISDVKFDVIVGNPPYQLNDGGGNGSSAKPIYQLFIQQAKKLNPRHMVMIVPARWQQGGKGLDDFRQEMLNDGCVSKMKTFSDSRDCFAGVDIAGGVCFFHRDRDYSGLCDNYYVDGHGVESKEIRSLNEYPVFIADNQAIDIVHQVRSRCTKNYGNIVRSRNPFGIGRGEESKSGELTLRWRGGLTRCSLDAVSAGKDLIPKWKVIISKASAEHAGQADSAGLRKIVSVIEKLEPNCVCSETYLVVDAFDTEQDADRLARYLRTRFARYLIWQATPTQNISKSCFAFLPTISKDINVSDEALFKEFGLSDKQADIITSAIKVIDSGNNSEE